MTDLSLVEVAFWAFAAVTAGGGIALALTRNVIYGAFTLFVVLLGMAGLYVLLAAEFLAVSQVIVYVGGILVILLFGVMLTNKLRELKPRTEIVNLIPGLLVAGGLFACFAWMVGRLQLDVAGRFAQSESIPADEVNRIGIATLTDWILPFELISVLLLAVLVGAAYLTRKPEGGKEAQS